MPRHASADLKTATQIKYQPILKCQNKCQRDLTEFSIVKTVPGESGLNCDICACCQGTVSFDASQRLYRACWLRFDPSTSLIIT